MVKLKFLGTGTSQGIPVIGSTHPVCLSSNPKDKRLRSSVLFQVDSKNIVVDTGPDFRQQMLSAGIDHLDAILFTHEHKDHLAGFDDIRPFYFRQGPLDVYGTEQAFESLKKSFDYIFAEFKYPGVPEVNLHNISHQSPFEHDGISINAIEVLHYKLPVLGFRIGDLSYITDANFISEEEKKKLKGTKILVLNALRKEKHISHFNLEEAIALAQEIGAEHTYFTHISHLLGFHDEVEQELPKGIHLAYDGLEVSA